MQVISLVKPQYCQRMVRAAAKVDGATSVGFSLPTIGKGTETLGEKVNAFEASWVPRSVSPAKRGAPLVEKYVFRKREYKVGAYGVSCYVQRALSLVDLTEIFGDFFKVTGKSTNDQNN